MRAVARLILKPVDGNVTNKWTLRHFVSIIRETIMKKFTLIDKEVALYFATARERYRIMLRRAKGQESPWSNDRIFNDWYFCNVFREDDKVTKWIKNNVREPNRNDPGVIWRIIACWVFNRILTLEKLHFAGVFSGRRGWNRDLVETLLENEKPLTGAVYRVYIPAGMDRLRGCLKFIDDAVACNGGIVSNILPGVTTQQDVWEMLLSQNGLSPSMAYEVVTDLTHTYLLENAPDTTTWANPGPGACLGLSRLVGENVSYGSASHRAEAIHCMQELLAQARKNWPAWDMRTVEHWLCEFHKWCWVHFEGKRMKRKCPAK